MAPVDGNAVAALEVERQEEHRETSAFLPPVSGNDNSSFELRQLFVM